tara:strand:- start:280 stop:639 length:360 start_codon:yes stop_codon:yes gene_type:complete
MKKNGEHVYSTVFCKNCKDNIGLTDVQGYYTGVCKDCEEKEREREQGKLKDMDEVERDAIQRELWRVNAGGSGHPNRRRDQPAWYDGEYDGGGNLFTEEEVQRDIEKERIKALMKRRLS